MEKYSRCGENACVRPWREAIRCESGTIQAPDALKAWEANSDTSGEAKERVQTLINSTVVLISELDTEAGQLVLGASSDNGSPECPEDRIARGFLDGPSWVIPYKGSLTEAISASAPWKTANARHPLIEHYLSYQYSEHPTELEEFAHSFVALVSDEAAGESNFLIKPTRWHKRAACLYFAVPWEHYDDTVKPPYKMWTHFGIREIDEDLLTIWRDATVPSR